MWDYATGFDISQAFRVGFRLGRFIDFVK